MPAVGEVTGRPAPVGILAIADQLDLDGMDVPAADLARLLGVDVARWRAEMARRAAHLAQFPDLPEEIWQAHHRIAADLDTSHPTTG